MIRKFISGFAFLLAACSSPEDGETATLDGIDVSHFQGDIDWDKTAKAGIHFVYIKASEGLHTKDAHFKVNWAGARAQGLLVGPYHFFHPDENAELQAQHFIDQLKMSGVHMDGTLPPVLDVEIPEGINAYNFRSDVMQWLTSVERAIGCKPIIYTSPHFWAEEDRGGIGGYKLWLADYAKNPTMPNGWDNWTFWQHTQNGKITGINSLVDLSIFAGDKTQMEAMACKATR